MKKAKIMLGVLLVLVCVASMLSFRIDRYSKHYIFVGKKGSRVCTKKVEGAAILGGSPNAAASTISLSINCPDVFTTEISDN